MLLDSNGITTNSWAVKEFSSKGISTQNKLIFFSFCYCIEELCERWYLLHAKSESQLFVQRKFSKKRGENEHIYKCHPFHLYNESCFASDFSFLLCGKKRIWYCYGDSVEIHHSNLEIERWFSCLFSICQMIHSSNHKHLIEC